MVHGPLHLDLLGTCSRKQNPRLSQMSRTGTSLGGGPGVCILYQLPSRPQLREASLPLLGPTEAERLCFWPLVSSNTSHGQHSLEFFGGAQQKQLEIVPLC